MNPFLLKPPELFTGLEMEGSPYLTSRSFVLLECGGLAGRRRD